MAEGYVYFVYAHKVRRVKIGYSSRHPEIRLDAIQTGCPVRLKRLGYFRGTVADERNLHYRFISARRTGEWFRLSDELRSFMRAALEPWPAPRASFDRARYDQVIWDAAEWASYKEGFLGEFGCAAREPDRRCREKSSVRVGPYWWCEPHAEQVRWLGRVAYDPAEAYRVPASVAVELRKWADSALPDACEIVSVSLSRK